MLDQNTLQHYTALIFDMDGTIIDTMPSHALAWQKVGEILGYPITGEIMYELGGATVSTIARETMKRHQIPEQYFAEMVRLKREIGFEIIKQKAALLPTFDIVKAYQGKKPLALGTGSHGIMVDLLSQKFQLQDYFDVIVNADQVTHHKPHPETFLRCAELLNVDPTRCLVFEDADLGVQAGLAGGMDVFDVRINQIINAK
ncbi:beta-phosphoglucomutase family hydrolase [Lonepinella sp. BR2474]|uniref:beta-phosphoglucomutase family hydrolase n=1 Tax=Lonepinella sp. BR2474 TaxID=3434548 RepID=UPI003F6DD020